MTGGATSLLTRLGQVWQAAKALGALASAGKTIATAASAGSPPVSVFASIEVAAAFINNDPRARTLVSLGERLSGGEGVDFLRAVEAHDWAAALDEGLTASVTAAAALGVPGAAFAAKLLPLVHWAAHHPEDVASPAMRKATGADDPYDHGAGGAYSAGAI